MSAKTTERFKIHDERELAAIRDILPHLRARPNIKTVSTVAGTIRVKEPGERVYYGPNGEVVFRVVEDTLGGCQIEEDEHLHATIRPRAVRFGQVVRS